MEHECYGPYERYVKRPLDCFLASVALIVFSPVIGITALIVKIKIGSPVFFTRAPRANRPQNRKGKNISAL